MCSSDLGYIVTYFAGAAFAKAMVAFKVLDKVDAGLAAGLVQLVTYTGIIIWAAAMTSVKKTWLSLAALTAVCAAVIYFTRIP